MMKMMGMQGIVSEERSVILIPNKWIGEGIFTKGLRSMRAAFRGYTGVLVLKDCGRLV
jgi:hypothetical protein